MALNATARGGLRVRISPRAFLDANRWYYSQLHHSIELTIPKGLYEY